MRGAIPEFSAALKFDTENKKFSKFAPILYRDGVQDPKNLFKCQHLALVHYFHVQYHSFNGFVL